MADERWLDDLKNDPDLMSAAGDDVDQLIKSTLEEIAHVDRIMGETPEPEPDPEPTPEPETPPKEVFQPKIPDIYADLTLDDEEEEEEPVKRPRKRLATGWRVLIYVASVLIVSFALAIFGWYCADDVLALTKPDRTVSITVAKDDTIDDIAQTLYDNDLIEYQWLFKFYCWFSHAEERIEAGTYELNNVYDYHALVSGMSGNNRIIRTVTIPEGYTCQQIFELLESSGVCKADELYEAAANLEFDYDFLQGLPYGDDNRLEGYLFPDTYDFYSVKSEDEDENDNWVWPEGAVGDDAERVLTKFLDNFQNRFTEEMKASIDELNATLSEKMRANGFTEEEIAANQLDLRDIVIVASLIEKETSSAKESPLISSVIYNRLCSKVYPLLQIDATVLYALGEHKEALTAEDLTVDSPYNTYRYPGLPAGPISNPGLDSLDAALHPESTNYYFYALDTDGTHHFSETNQEHQAFLDQLETAQ